MKDELGGKIMKKLLGLKAKTYSYLLNSGNQNKKNKTSVMIRKLKIENYKNCLGATQLEDKINYLEKYETDVDNLVKDHRDFLRE